MNKSEIPFLYFTVFYANNISWRRSRLICIIDDYIDILEHIHRIALHRIASNYWLYSLQPNVNMTVQSIVFQLIFLYGSVILLVWATLNDKYITPTSNVKSHKRGMMENNEPLQCWIIKFVRCCCNSFFYLKKKSRNDQNEKNVVNESNVNF